MSDAQIPDSICVTTLVHPAHKGDVEAFLGQIVFSPVPEEVLLVVLEGIGAHCEKLFPETFQYGQVVAIRGVNEPDHMGVMVVLAPFEDEAGARQYMQTASEIVRAEITMRAAATHDAPTTPQ